MSEKIIFTFNKPFYFWGLLPKKEVVLIDKEFAKRGHTQIVGLEIEEIERGKQAAWFGFTLGFYYPRAFKVSGFEKI